MIENINVNNGISGVTPGNDDLLSGLHESTIKAFTPSNFEVNTDFVVEDASDTLSQFSEEIVDNDVESNPIVKEVFDSIKTDHNIDLSQDPVVIDTLKALLYL